MNKFFLLLTMVYIVLVSGASLATDCVQIGNTTYTQSEIEKYIKKEGVDPIWFVRHIKRKEIINILTEKRGLNRSLSKDSMYTYVTGFGYQNDKQMERLLVVESETRQAASSRQLLFHKWIIQQAEELVPVVYLDPESFMRILKNSPSFKARANSGVTPSIDDWVYTWKELQVDSNLVIALKNEEPYLTGKEFNKYVKANYESMRYIAKRKTNLDTLRRVVTIDIIAGKIAINDTAKLSDTNIEELTNRFVRQMAFGIDFSMKHITAHTPSDYMEKMYKKFHNNHTDEVASFKENIKNREYAINDNYLGVLLHMRAKKDALKEKIGATIKEEEINKWIRLNSDYGSYKDAKSAFISEKYNEHIDTMIKREDIMVIAF